MAKEQEKRAIHAYTSVEARDAWNEFADLNGVSVTGLLEALGLELIEELDHSDATEIRQAWVKAGRRVDAERRKR